jgi:hypothetical protein
MIARIIDLTKKGKIRWTAKCSNPNHDPLWDDENSTYTGLYKSIKISFRGMRKEAVKINGVSVVIDDKQKEELYRAVQHQIIGRESDVRDAKLRQAADILKG